MYSLVRIPRYSRQSKKKESVCVCGSKSGKREGWVGVFPAVVVIGVDPRDPSGSNWASGIPSSFFSSRKQNKKKKGMKEKKENNKLMLISNQIEMHVLMWFVTRPRQQEIPKRKGERERSREYIFVCKILSLCLSSRVLPRKSQQK